MKDQALSLGEAEKSDADLFGRSAFNRFYYAAFLITRQLIRSVFPDLPSQHASIPEFLRGSVGKELGKRKQRAMKASDHAAVKLAQDARVAAGDLADLLVRGYGARVAADYHPEVAVSFHSSGFTLNEVTLADAESWPYKARKLSLMIVQAMRQTDVS